MSTIIPALYMNNKTRERYITVLQATNATNTGEGESMIVYTKHRGEHAFYVREFTEFEKKFTLVD